ncbi:uncharacterized protein [Odocoileus virginianus]|uniref:Uncharacterized protein n=1 Tax=Odocoileus virginianus TaxID=9874 RepID=A0ABM4HYG4_ODOVR
MYVITTLPSTVKCQRIAQDLFAQRDSRWKGPELLLALRAALASGTLWNAAVWLLENTFTHENCGIFAAAAKSLQSCPTLRPHRRQPTRLLCPWDSPGKNAGVGCHFPVQCMIVKSGAGIWLSCDITTLERCKFFLRPEAGPSRLWPTSSFSKRWRLLATSTGAPRNSVRDGLAHLTDSDLCMAEWYRSSFGPNLTELAGSLTLALRVKAASELSLRGLIRKEVVRGLERCRALLKVGEARVGEGTSASASVLGVLTCRVTGGRPPARGRGPTEDSGSFSGPAPRCPRGLDGRPTEAGCSRAWGRLHLEAGVFLKTVAFSDTILFSETLALSGTALFPETALSSSTAIFWDTEHLLGLGVSGSRLASGSTVFAADGFLEPAGALPARPASSAEPRSGLSLRPDGDGTCTSGAGGGSLASGGAGTGASQRLCLLSCRILRTAQTSSSSLGSGAGGRGPSASSTLSSLSGRRVLVVCGEAQVPVSPPAFSLLFLLVLQGPRARLDRAAQIFLLTDMPPDRRASRPPAPGRIRGRFASLAWAAAGIRPSCIY